MNKLPREAKDFLALVADAHDPPDEAARQRVQARLAALALLPAARPHAPMAPDLAAHAGAHAASGWLASSKFLLAGALALVLGGGLWSLSPTRQTAPAAPRRASHEPASLSLATGEAPPAVALRSAPLVQQAEVVTVPVPVEAAAAPAPVRPARLEHAAPSASSLAEEAALLQRAGEHLARRDLEGAQRLLEVHRRRYHGSQLAEERAGLAVLARCLRDPHTAAEQARSFVTRSPGSLLVPRLVSACAL